MEGGGWQPWDFELEMGLDFCVARNKWSGVVLSEQENQGGIRRRHEDETQEKWLLSVELWLETRVLAHINSEQTCPNEPANSGSYWSDSMRQSRGQHSRLHRCNSEANLCALHKNVQPIGKFDLGYLPDDRNLQLRTQ